MNSIQDEELIEIEQGNAATYEVEASHVYANERLYFYLDVELMLFLERLQGSNILDVGCGIGRFAGDISYSTQEGEKGYVGIDISEKMLEYAREEYPNLTFRKMSFRQLDFPDAIFDGFWAAYVLQHERKDNIVNVLKELKRVTKPGGIGMIALPIGNEAKWYESHYTKEMSLYIAFWQEQEFIQKLEEAGMEVTGSWMTTPSFCAFFVKT